MIDIEIFQALFQNATEGIIITDKDGIMRSVNPSAATLFGYSTDELEGKKVELLIPVHLRDKHTHHRTQFQSETHPRPMGKNLTLTGRKKDESLFPIEISLSPFGHNSHRYVIAFVVDVTEKKMAEEKLKNYNRELEKQVQDRTLVLQDAINQLERTREELKESLEQEKELNDMKSRFVSMASHEFRTPLATILSSLSLIQQYIERNDPEKLKKHMLRIKSSVGNMTDILNDFLSLSKLEEGKIAYDPVTFEPQPFFEDVVQEMQNIARGTQLLNLQYDGENSPWYLDRKILQNVMMNLLSNAIKFSREDGTIDIRVHRTADTTSIRVSDSGIGISKEDLNHLFERFHRGKNAFNIQGTGLGLNIVKKYVELMSGDIHVESELNVGTTFTITIPEHKTQQA